MGKVSDYNQYKPYILFLGQRQVVCDCRFAASHLRLYCMPTRMSLQDEK